MFQTPPAKQAVGVFLYGDFILGSEYLYTLRTCMPTALRNTAFLVVRTLREQQLLPFVIVFVALLATIKLAQYIFFTLETSPAVVLAPAGIALAAVLLGGYRMWMPIALAQAIATFTSPSNPPFLLATAVMIGQTVQPLIGAYLLKQFGFEGNFRHIRDALLLIGAALFVTMIAPTISISIQWLLGTLSDNWFLVWSRAWGGGILSVLVFTPLITTWFPLNNTILTRKEAIETAISFGSLVLISIALYWLPLGQWGLSLPAIYIFLAALFWIALRYEPRIMSASLFTTTVFGVLGAIIARPTPTRSLAEQLFSVEMFIVLMGVIFMVFAAVAEERRQAIRRLEEHMNELAHSLEKMGTADKAKNEFIAILAHELRNPLAPVMSTLEILKIKDQDPESARLIDSAEQQMHSMRRLLDDLLDVARVAQQKFKLQKQDVLLHDALRHTIETTESFIKSRGQTLEVSMPTQQVSFFADPVRFEQIVVNLLNNAAKYTPRGGHIMLSGWVEDSTLIVRVEDDGIGIPAERLEEIFEPFRQVSSAPRVGTGLGIGLSLTKRLVEMHHGVIEAASMGPGKGSTFTVRLPLTSFSPVPTPYVDAVQLQNSNTKYKILVVDDNEPAAEGLKRLLEHKGHEVRVAYSGNGALETFPSFMPDVVLLDIGLPDINGYEVADYIRKNLPNSKPMLIALTGYGQDEDKAMARSVGFDYHLTKPVSLKELENLLYRLVPSVL